MASLLTKLSKKGLIIAHLNICSLKNKIHEVMRICTEDNIQVLALSETHLDMAMSNSELMINGFKLYRKDRDKYGGGVAFYIREHFGVLLREDLMNSYIEDIWVEISVPHCKPILAGCCYRPPSANLQYLDRICESMNRVTDENKAIFLLGDFNIDWMAKNCSLTKKLKSMADTCNFTQMIIHPTRIVMKANKVSTSSCIDLIFTNVQELCSKAVSVAVGCSDHNLIALTKKTKIPKSGARILLSRSYKRFNQDLFINEVQSVQWTEVCQEKDVNKALNIFMDIINKIIDKYAPLRKRSVKTKNAPWLDDELKCLMLQRDKAKEVGQKLGSDYNKKFYCKLRNRVSKLNHIKKREYYKQKIRSAAGDSKKIWKTLNEIMSRKSNNYQGCVENEGQFITKPLEIANYFNTFFNDKVNNLRSSMYGNNVQLACSPISKIMKNKLCSFNFRSVDQTTVEEMLLSIPDDKPCGADQLDGKLLKMVARQLSQPICHIYNRCLIGSIYPNLWKESKIIPLLKKGKTDFLGSNCRPISILPILSKLLEKIIFKQILQYFSINGLLANAQHAYRPGHSTSTALIHMTDEWLACLDNKKLVGAVLIDFTAAFDVIDHDILMAKLKCYGFSLTALNWMGSYLSNRKQRVFYNGSFSDAKNTYCGVPQGSCLGPLLFSIFINDLPYVVNNANIVMYADDSTMFSAAHSSAELKKNLSDELLTISKWVQINKLILNIEKTKCIIFSQKYNISRAADLNLFIDGTPVEQVTDVTLLGVILDNTLSWSKHIDHIVSSMGKGIAVARKCSAFISSLVLKDVVQSIVLSHLEYCPIIWSSASEKHLKKLQIVQNRAARLVLHYQFQASVADMHRKLSWLLVKDKLHLRVLVYFYKVIKYHTPCFFFEKLVYVGFRHDHKTRQVSKSQLFLPCPQSNLLKKTVFYRGSAAWNVVPINIRKSNSTHVFKRNCVNMLLKV